MENEIEKQCPTKFEIFQSHFILGSVTPVISGSVTSANQLVFWNLQPPHASANRRQLRTCGTCSPLINY